MLGRGPGRAPLLVVSAALFHTRDPLHALSSPSPLLRTPLLAGFDVFISHAGPQKPLATELHDMLRNQLGLSVFLDKGMAAGDAADDTMLQADSGASSRSSSAGAACCRRWSCRYRTRPGRSSSRTRRCGRRRCPRKCAPRHRAR